VASRRVLEGGHGVFIVATVWATHDRGTIP
jgi:hypothetical protein